MPKPKLTRPTYLAHVVPGLEPVAAYEIARRLPQTGPVRALKGFDERTSILSFPHGGAAAELLALRTLEDLFVLAAESDAIPGSFAGQRMIQAAVADSPLLDLAATLALEQRGRRPKKPAFRVIARKSGEHAFRRVDLQVAVEKGITSHFPDWRLVEDDAHLEVWATLVRGLLVAGIRLSGSELRHRTYKSVSLPASLKPTIGAAVALLSQPRDDDTVLDPMCGAGTVLIERAEAGRYAQLLGGDIDPAAVEAAKTNVGRRYQPITLRQWDARELPLTDASVNALICNLPFGRQIGTPEQNRSLYPTLLAEWTRVLAPGGRMVLLTSERRLLAQTVARQRALRLTAALPVTVLGVPAAIHLVERTAGEAGPASAEAQTAGA